MSIDLSIRPVTPLDYDQWLPLWHGYNAFYGRSGPTALPSEITQKTWARFFDADEPVYALAAEASGQLIGLAHYLFHRSTITISPTCYLQDLFTAEAARGKGAGRALIQGVYQEAKEAGCTRVYWHTHETNQTARRLYDQVAENPGFIVYRNHEWTRLHNTYGPTACERR
jgi:GNAT superfamily N-acetyltransferase